MRIPPIITEGTLPNKPIITGEKEKIIKSAAAGRRVKRDAHLVKRITPGLMEKLTGPMTPRKPDSTLARPVMVIPRFTRFSMSSTSTIPFME